MVEVRRETVIRQAEEERGIRHISEILPVVLWRIERRMERANKLDREVDRGAED